MADMASAKAKYARKTGPGSPAVSNYNAAKGRAAANWSGGMARFLGSPVSASRTAAYQAGLSAANYQGGDPDKWERNFRASMAA
jgi:hypothetical protein